MDLEEDEDIWGHTVRSPNALLLQPLAMTVVSPYGVFISTQLNLNSRLHLLSTAGGFSTVGACIYAADGSRRHMDLGGGAPFFFAYNLNADVYGCARKQAYIRELEQEVQLLQQENKSLRNKYDQEVLLGRFGGREVRFGGGDGRFGDGEG